MRFNHHPRVTWVALLLQCSGQLVQALPSSKQSNVRDNNPPDYLVDLGYALYKPTLVNNNTGYLTYQNIRYAASPTGNLRFAPPAAPDNVHAQGPIAGSPSNTICPQYNPDWAAPAVNGLGPDAVYTIPPGLAPTPQSEDCLFMDVRTPISVFDKKNGQAGDYAQAADDTQTADKEKKKKKKKLPVLVFIHGGGFVVGVKAKYDPTQLLTTNGKDVIYVAFQYRLGAFGWLTDPDHPEAITPNLGLLDQRAALKWIRDHIGQFGGDPDQVTIMGESAGGGSVLLHATAHGGSKETDLISRGIPQSPFIYPITKIQQRKTLSAFLAALGVSTIAQAKSLPYAALQAANGKVVGPATYGAYTFGPVVDGKLVPEYPGKLFQQGKFNRKLDMMPAHNSNEGRLFANQTAPTEADFTAFLNSNFPGATPSKVTFVQTKLYPAKFDGSLPYTNPQQRLALIFSEAFLNCPGYGAAKAYAPSHSYEYLFGVTPGFHFQDISYTFANGPSPIVNATVAAALQSYIINFTKTGNPSGGNSQPGLPQFPPFGADQRTLNITDHGLTPVKERDEAAKRRCDFWLGEEIFSQ